MNTHDSNNCALDNLLSELSLIHDLSTRNFVTQVILNTPGTFWYRPSAFYKGHHPSDEYSEWGNLLHVKRCLVIAEILSQSEDLTSIDSDALYSALLIHDVGKYGEDGSEERIRRDHPDLVSVIFPELLSETKKPICSIVQSHMGRWGRVKPVTKLETLGHYCDCIASRPNVVVAVRLK